MYTYFITCELYQVKFVKIFLRSLVFLMNLSFAPCVCFSFVPSSPNNEPSFSSSQFPSISIFLRLSFFRLHQPLCSQKLFCVHVQTYILIILLLFRLPFFSSLWPLYALYIHTQSLATGIPKNLLPINSKELHAHSCYSQSTEDLLKKRPIASSSI